MDIFPLIHMAKSRLASDLHLVADNPPLVRIHGSLGPLDGLAPLTSDDLEQVFQQLAGSESREHFDRSMELDFGYTIPDIVRLRCNAAKQRGTVSIVIRLLPLMVPSFDQLDLPDICKELVVKPRGMVIVSGPTGSGKSTTLAAMIDYLNHTHSRRVVTIEDPIEYVYTNMKCTITQRELGTDTLSFAEALKHVLRQDPDVILVGELRDLETASAALTIAETGHLLLTTGHAPSSSQAIERVIDLFPPHERPLAQTRLASLLIGVLCQALVPKADGAGRIAAVEILLANTAVRNLIREGKIYQLPNVIRTHSRMGMGLLDQSLADLYRKELINMEQVLAFCNDREEIEKLINMEKKGGNPHLSQYN